MSPKKLDAKLSGSLGGHRRLVLLSHDIAGGNNSFDGYLAVNIIFNKIWPVHNSHSYDIVPIFEATVSFRERMGQSCLTCATPAK
jgi:hypothetical protein